MLSCNSPLGCESTLAKLYLSAGGHQDLTSELIKGRVLPTSSSSAHPHWTNLVPKIIDILLTKLYPLVIVVCKDLDVRCTDLSLS